MDYERSLLLTNPEQWLDALRGLTPSSLLVALDKSAATLDDAGLEQQLDVAIASLSNGAFVRTSLRSPKDSSVALHKQKAHFREFAAREKDADDNRKMIVLLEGALNAMHVTTGKQALELLRSSDRVKEDLERFRHLCPNIVVRQWINVDPANEFRAFVVNGRITALSQYYSTLFFPKLVEDKDKIQHILFDFFNDHVLPRLNENKEKFPSEIIVDFLIGADDNKCWVVELNPYGESTHACLFDWRTDLKTLKGNAPFEFRIRNEPLKLTAADKMTLKKLLQDE